MKTPALTILESVYGLTFNPNLPYTVQLEQLAASGVLANKKSLNEVVFKLCELVDKQQQQLDKLLKEEALPDHPVTNIDPTKPL